jgi:sec-independent protein translocase protein TatA
MFGSTELIVIVLIIFILFGAKSIPKFAKSLGEARKEFQDSFNEENKSKDSTDKKDSSQTK